MNKAFVKRLQQETGYSIHQCNKASKFSKGDIETARAFLKAKTDLSIYPEDHFNARVMKILADMKNENIAIE